MSEPDTKYKITLSELRQRCPLLEKIEVAGYGPEYGCSHSKPGTEQLVGRIAGQIVVRAKGKITPRLIEQFRNTYQQAVAAGIIKPQTEQEPK